MLTKTGAKLLAFGLAKAVATESELGTGEVTLSSSLTAPSTIFGTLAYMAPEQISGREADARADLFFFRRRAVREGNRPKGISGK